MQNASLPLARLCATVLATAILMTGVDAQTAPPWGCVISEGNSLVWVSPADGHARVLATDFSTDEAQVARISPDAWKLSYLTQGRELRILNLVTGASAPADQLGEADWQGSEHPWSPDSKLLVYVKQGNLHVTGFGQAPRTLTATGDVGTAAWSPDGQSIAYTRRGTSDQDLGLWVVPAAGGTPRLVASPNKEEPVYAASRPLWSPDGKRIAFLRAWEGGSLCFVDLATSKQQVDIDIAWTMFWLANSSGVVFSAEGPETGWFGLRKCKVGAKPTVLLRKPVLAADMLPGGDILVAYDHKARTADDLSGVFRVMVIGADGARRHAGWQVDLTGFPRRCKWRPDGKQLAVLAGPMDGSGTLRVGAAGGQLKAVRKGVDGFAGFGRGK